MHCDENIEAKVEIAQDEQFLLWPQCFQRCLTIKLSFMELLHKNAICFQSRLLHRDKQVILCMV